MQYTNLSWFVKAGMLFDLRRYCIIFKTQSFRGRVQCYDTEKDEGVTLIGDLKQQISKTVKYDIQGQVKIDHMCLSPNMDWLFMVQHWTNGIYEGSMNLYEMDSFVIAREEKKGLCAIGEALIDFVADQKGVALKDVSSFTRAAGGAPAGAGRAHRHLLHSGQDRRPADAAAQRPGLPGAGGHLRSGL